MLDSVSLNDSIALEMSTRTIKQNLSLAALPGMYLYEPNVSTGLHLAFSS